MSDKTSQRVLVVDDDPLIGDVPGYAFARDFNIAISPAQALNLLCAKYSKLCRRIKPRQRT